MRVFITNRFIDIVTIIFMPLIVLWMLLKSAFEGFKMLWIDVKLEWASRKTYYKQPRNEGEE